MPFGMANAHAKSSKNFKNFGGIQKNNLQDPEDKQFFICDDKLEKVFGVQRCKAFGMAKYLQNHLF